LARQRVICAPASRSASGSTCRGGERRVARCIAGCATRAPGNRAAAAGQSFAPPPPPHPPDLPILRPPPSVAPCCGTCSKASTPPISPIAGLPRTSTAKLACERERGGAGRGGARWTWWR
jgi:hypothetical protein